MVKASKLIHEGLPKKKVERRSSTFFFARDTLH